jgi:serine/threonine-protein kinase
MGEGLRLGEVLAGRYLIEHVLGVGGGGMVLAARHVDLGAHRAVKIPWPHEAEAAERLLEEARITARLASEHVVRVHDAGRLEEDGAPFIAMELLQGVDLLQLLQRRGPLPAGDAALYVAQACLAMEEAHALGIVHLDLKPANLFLTSRHDGSACVKVIDFGIARSLEEACPMNERVEGTPPYMAPEQAILGPRIGAETDVWALGVTLYELLAGRVPFRAGTVPGVLRRVLEAEPEPLGALRPGLPPGLADVIERCLRKGPASRFRDAAELGAALAPFASDARICSTPIPRSVRNTEAPHAATTWPLPDDSGRVAGEVWTQRRTRLSLTAAKAG